MASLPETPSRADSLPWGLFIHMGHTLRDAAKGRRLLRANGCGPLSWNGMTLIPFALRLSKGAFLAVTLLAFFAHLTAAQPAPVTIHASVDRKEITIGDPIRYTVEVSAAADTEILIPVLSGAVGDFTISDFGDSPPRKGNGRVVASRWYTLTTFEAGDHLIP